MTPAPVGFNFSMSPEHKELVDFIREICRQFFEFKMLDDHSMRTDSNFSAHEQKYFVRFKDSPDRIESHQSYSSMYETVYGFGPFIIVRYSTLSTASDHEFENRMGSGRDNHLAELIVSVSKRRIKKEVL